MKISLTISVLSQIVLVNGKRGGKFFKNKQRQSLKKFVNSNRSTTENDDSLVQYLSKKQECDPKLTITKADLGVLSCGSGRQCIPDNESLLGGFCSNNTSLRSRTDRALQTCPDLGEEELDFDGYGCDCSNYVSGMGGPITDCIIDDDICSSLEGAPNGETELCYDSTASVVFGESGNRETAYYCYEVSMPYTRTGCVLYTYDTTESCQLTIDDVNCNSCTPVSCDGLSPASFTFDCTNTVTAVSGSTCDGQFPLPIFLYIADDNVSMPNETESPSSVLTAPMPSLSPNNETADDNDTPMPATVAEMPSPSPMDITETQMPAMASTTPSPVESPTTTSDSALQSMVGFVSITTALAASASLFW